LVATFGFTFSTTLASLFSSTFFLYGDFSAKASIFGAAYAVFLEVEVVEEEGLDSFGPADTSATSLMFNLINNTYRRYCNWCRCSFLYLLSR
jgi:hypothetical protein